MPDHDDDLPAVPRDVDKLCDAFVAAWENGEDPRIEDYVARLSQDNRDLAWRELISEEVRLAHRRWTRASPRRLREAIQPTAPGGGRRICVGWSRTRTSCVCQTLQESAASASNGDLAKALLARCI